MPIVNVPGVGKVRFPDSMSQEQIISAIETDILKKPEASTGEGSWLGDVGRSFASGLVGVSKGMTDVFGPETAPSKYLGEAQETLQRGLSPARQAEIQRRKQLEEEASKSGDLIKEIGTFLGGVAEAPVQSLAQGLGSIVPFLGTGVVGAVARLGAPTVTALNTALGAAIGAGSVKGSLYDNVKTELEKQGMRPEEAKAKAAEAQSYLGDNFLSIASGAVLGGFGARTGAERLLTAEGRQAAPATLGRRVGKAVAEEAPVEAAQAGQEQLAINLALQKQGIDVDALQGVFGAAARDAAIGALTAGAVGIAPTAKPTAAPGVVPSPAAEPAVEEPAVALTPEQIADREKERKLSGFDFDALVQTEALTLGEEAAAAAPATAPAVEAEDVTAAIPTADDIARVAPVLKRMGFTDFSKITTPEQQAELVRLADRHAIATAVPEKTNIRKKIDRLLQTGNVEIKKPKGRKDEKPVVGGEQLVDAKAVERRDVSGTGMGVPVSGTPTDASAATGTGGGGLDVAQGPAATATEGKGKPAGALTAAEAAPKEEISEEEQAALQAELQAEQAGETVSPEVSAAGPIRQPRKRGAAESVTEEQALEVVTEQSADLSDIANAVKTIEETKDRKKYQQAVQYLVATANDKSGTSKGARRAAELALNRIPEMDRQAAAQELVQLAETQKTQQLRNVAGKIQKLDSRIQQLTDEYKDAKKSGDADVLTDIKNKLDELTEQRKGLKKEQRTVEKSEVLLRRVARAAREGAGMGKPAVQQIVDRIKAKWKGAPKIEVASSYEALPRPLREFLTRNDAEDARGVFYIPTKTVYVIAANNDSETEIVDTLAHETIGHFGLRQVLGNKYVGTMNLAYMNPEVKRLADSYIEQNPGTSKLIAVEEALAELVEAGRADASALRGLMNRLTAMLRQFLRYISNNKIANQFSDAEVRNLLASSRELVESGEGSSATITTVAPEGLLARSDREVKQALGGARTPEEEIEKFTEGVGEKFDKDLTKASLYKSSKNLFTTSEGWNTLVRRFQNDRVVPKNFQDGLSKAGKLISGGENLNNVYDQLTLSAGRAAEVLNQYLYYPMKRVEDTVYKYATAAGLSTADALKKIHVYSLGRHEAERRDVKYIRTVPLRNDIEVEIKELGIKDTPANIRQRVYNTLDRNENLVTKGTAKKLRGLLDNLVEKYKDPKGFSPNGYKNIDKYDREYDVLAELSQDAVNLIRKQYDADPNRELLEEIFAAAKEVQNQTVEVNKQANYWTQPVSNYVDFYGYKNYMPFKGKPEPKVDRGGEIGGEQYDDPNSKRFSRDFLDAAYSMEGRTSISDNPLTQTMADGARAALRLGRKDVGLAVKNLLKQKYLKGEMHKIPFDERDSDTFKKYQGNKYIYNYEPDGAITVLEIKDLAFVEGVRRAYRSSQPLIQMLNSATSLIGQFHTRYNPAFAPMNFVRDALTNAFTIGAEMGGKAMFDYLGAVSSKVADGGMIKAYKFARMYAARDLDGLKKLAEKDPFIKDMYDYVQSGGRVSYVQGITAMSQMDELVKDIGRSKLMRTKEQMDKWVDIWTDMFEFTSRAAAYSVAKKNALAKGETEEAAKTIAAGYAKNLANFELVGEWGRAAGAAFMFFRPAATGAVRALDALKPIVQNADDLIARLPEAVRNDAEAVETFRRNHAAQQKQAKYMALSLMGAGATIWMMAWMMSDDDDLGRNRIATDDMSRWTRYLRLPVLGKENFLQIPTGFGLGAFLALGAQAAGTAFGSSSLKDMMGNTMTIALDSFIPIPVSRINPIDDPSAWLVDSLAPSIVRPLVEYKMNVDGLGREIYNNRKTRYGDAYTGGDNIPEAYKDASRFLARITNGGIDVGPNSLYFFANNYADAVTRIGHNTYNVGLTLANKKDFDPKTDLIFFDSFIGKASNFDAREFSSVEKQIQTKIARMNMFKKSDPEQYAKYIEANPMDPVLEYIYNKQVNGQLRNLREFANEVRRSDFDPKDRKEILDGLRLSQNMVKRALIDTFDLYDVKP